MSLREVDGQQINQQILPKFLDDFLSYKLFLVKRNSNILALKFEYFPLSLYQAHLLEKINIV